MHLISAPCVWHFQWCSFRKHVFLLYKTFFFSIDFIPIQYWSILQVLVLSRFRSWPWCHSHFDYDSVRLNAVTVSLTLFHDRLMLPALLWFPSIPAMACGMWHVYSNISTAQYFGANIVLLSISTSLTVLVLNIHPRGSRGNPVPAMVQMVVLARILGMGKCVPGKNKRTPNGAKSVRVNSRPIWIRHGLEANILSYHNDTT